MAMRLDVEFARPLSREEKTLVLMAAAGLAKSDRVRFLRGDYRVVVMGEGLSVRRLRTALVEQGLGPTQVRSSLGEDEDAHADDLPGAEAPGERVRAIGR
jgi:hypothetical protein